MEALQAMIEAMIASMGEDEELSLPFGPGEFDDADGELPETVRVRLPIGPTPDRHGSPPHRHPCWKHPARSPPVRLHNGRRRLPVGV